MPREIAISLSGGTFFLVVDPDEGGSVDSDLHYDDAAWDAAFGTSVGDDEDDLAEYVAYEGAINGVESFLLALAQAGVDVESEPVKEALQTTIDAIGNNL